MEKLYEKANTAVYAVTKKSNHANFQITELEYAAYLYQGEWIHLIILGFLQLLHRIWK